jgi:hypothetical protein
MYGFINTDGVLVFFKMRYWILSYHESILILENFII